MREECSKEWSEEQFIEALKQKEIAIEVGDAYVWNVLIDRW